MSSCPYFKKCGACKYDLDDYTKSLDEKRKQLSKLFTRERTIDLVPCETPYHYRHKVIFSFYKNQKREICAGLYQEESHKIIEIKDCLIQNEEANKLIKDIVKLANEFNLKVFDDRRGNGLLRHVLIRTSEASRKVLLTFVLGEEVFPGSKNFIKALKDKHPEIIGIVFNYNKRFTSVVLGDKEKLVYGSYTLKDELGPFTFQIASKSFYQVNPKMALKIYEDAIEAAKLRNSDVVLDAYSGTGTIALFASRYAKEVVGVEVNKNAVKNANANKEFNNVENVKFFASDVEDYMINHKFDVVFTDPPRSGMTESFINTLLHIKPRTIVYISCNPITMKRDLAHFSKDYFISSPRFYDQFAFTDHLEAMVTLNRKPLSRDSKNKYNKK